MPIDAARPGLNETLLFQFEPRELMLATLRRRGLRNWKEIVA
jgi:hypothetical protein